MVIEGKLQFYNSTTREWSYCENFCISGIVESASKVECANGQTETGSRKLLLLYSKSSTLVIYLSLVELGPSDEPLVDDVNNDGGKFCVAVSM